LITLKLLDPYHKLGEMWHPHVYGQPPKQPTPFSINNILQRKNDNGQQLQHWQDLRHEERDLHPLQIRTNNLISFFGANPISFPFAQVRKILAV
jgi:hypothetical protein